MDRASEEIVKIGVYEYEPFIMVDSNGNITGYYDDFFKLIKKKYGFEYEYVICSISEGLEKLENGEIDIMPGISIFGNDDSLIYNKFSILDEKFGVYSKAYDSLEELNNKKLVKLGIVKRDNNARWILEFLKKRYDNVEVVTAATYKELESLLYQNEIDLMIDNLYKKYTGDCIYEFAGNSIYIAGNENSQYILDNIDEAISYYEENDKKELNAIYNKYFEEKNNSFLISALISIISILSLGIAIIPRIKKVIVINKIKKRMIKEDYLLHYQPIYNPNTNNITGFEGLLRLKGKDNKLIPPFEFIPEIENNNMLFEMSIWILKKAIKDHKKIQKFNCVRGRDFYISVNISLNEIEDDDFVNQIIKIFSKSGLKHNNICLEIIERVKMNDISKITQNIDRLRNAGFKIAIDDFGVEYSNLDIIDKLDVDIIKIDKSFVDGIGKDKIKNEIILFISKLASFKKRAIVLEGVEEANQDSAIRKMKNNLLYVQGYYYSKPIYLEQIAEL